MTKPAALALMLASSVAMSAPPPMIVIVEQAAVMYAPGGQRIDIPAGTELDACADNGKLLAYDVEAMTVRIPQPCVERPLFVDGFEGDDPPPPRPRVNEVEEL